MFFPLGSDQLNVRRFPWLSLVVAGLTAGATLGPLAGQERGGAAVAAQRGAAISFWEEHPYLEIDSTFARRFIPAGTYQAAQERGRTRLASSLAPPPAQRQREQAQLAEMTATFWTWQAALPSQRYGLAADAGWWQLGWITYPLAYADPWQLLLHLVFFLTLAPFTEALYGRIGGGAFCAVVAIAAGVGHILAAPDPSVRLTGLAAVGAGCGGLFLLRFAWRRVQIHIWLGVTGRVVAVPGYLWAALPGVALAAMIRDSQATPLPWLWAAATGAGLALILWLTGLEGRLGADRGRSSSGVDAPLAPGLAPYRDLFRQFDDPYEAFTEVARRALDDRNDGAAAIAIDRLVAELLTRGDRAGITRVGKEFGGRIPAVGLGPPAAAALAEVSEEHDPWIADALYQSLADRGCEPGDAFLRAALLNLRRLQRPEQAAQWCERILDASDSRAELRERAGTLLAEAGHEAERWATVSRSERPRTGPAPVGEVEHELTHPNQPNDLELPTGDATVLRTVDDPEDSTNS